VEFLIEKTRLAHAWCEANSDEKNKKKEHVEMLMMLSFDVCVYFFAPLAIWFSTNLTGRKEH
jgi:hypothetical protein